MVSSFADDGAAPLADAPARNRLPSLDALRGAAVLLGLFTGVWVFGGFSDNDRTGLLVASKGFDYRLLGTVDILLESKMRALIGIVFGAGMVLLLRKPSPPHGFSTYELFVRRQMWLIAFGVINGLLLFWTRDVLFHLGIMGILLFSFARLKAKWLLVGALAATVIYCGKMYWDYADDRKTYSKYKAVLAAEEKIKADSVTKAKAIAAAGLKDSVAKKDTLTKKQAGEKGAWEGLVAGRKYNPEGDNAEDKEMRSDSYGSLYEHLLPAFQTREAQWTYRYGVWDFASAIFLGMALLKLGFFGGRRARSRYWLLALATITAGVLLAWYRLHNEQLSLQDYARYIDAHPLPYNLFLPFERLLTATGYAALGVGFVSAGGQGLLLRGFAAVGKLALTNYLLQSIVCALVFTGFGGGYFGRLPQYQLYLFALEVCLFQVVFSSIWLKRFDTGPAEWLWRCLIQGKRLPFRRRTSIDTASASFTDL